MQDDSEEKIIQKLLEFIQDSFELPTEDKPANIQMNIHELTQWIHSIWGVYYDMEILARCLFAEGYRFTVGEVPQWQLCSKE